MGKAETRRMCLLGKLFKERKFEQYGLETTSYDLIGSVHLDYPNYIENTTRRAPSYRLDYW